MDEIFRQILSGNRSCRLCGDYVRDFDALRRRTPELLSLSGADDWDLAIKEASGRLAYVNDELTVKSVAESVPGAVMAFDCTVTTTKRDRDGDVLETAGAELDPLAPLLWQHVPLMPCGKLVKKISQTRDLLSARNAIADTELGRDAAVLVDFGALRISHGFKPLEWEPIREKSNEISGMRFLKFKILEISLVSVPSNEDAIITAFSRAKLHSPFIKAWAADLRTKQPATVVGGYSPTPGGKAIIGAEDAWKSLQESAFKEAMAMSVPAMPSPKPVANVKRVQADPMRWNLGLSKLFDVAAEVLEPSCMEYDWVSRWLEVPVKSIHMQTVNVPGHRMGSFLTGLRRGLSAEFVVKDVRNLQGKSEAPPEYESIKLNSKSSDTFLVRGTGFYKGETHNLVIDHSPSWSGLYLTFYCPAECRQNVEKILSNAWDWAKENNFLKGEAFSLSGEFLQKTGETFGDLFLEPANETAVKRVLERLNAKGKQFANHGMVLSGPPGTGKTLAARILLNQANASFIWVSARDFHRMGSFDQAFELAKEIAPTILCFEDVDNWISRHTVDYLKAEMDGVGRSSGLLTLLTTNFPETLPEALIDRPGRFHDVLQFGLPSEIVRRAMLRKWLPGLDESKVADAAKRTDGYSGAHLYHLAAFAKGLTESESLDLDKAVDLAMDKVAEQRDLINGIQLEGSRYRPNKEMAAIIAKRAVTIDGKPYHKSETPMSEPAKTVTKGPIKLGKRRSAMLVEATALVAAAHDHAELKESKVARGMLREAKNLIGTAIKPPETPEEDDDEVPPDNQPKNVTCPKCGKMMPSGGTCECGHSDKTPDANPGAGGANPGTQGPNPGVGKETTADSLSVELLSKLYADQAPTWEVLVSLKEQIDAAVERQERAAADRLLAAS